MTVLPFLLLILVGCTMNDSYDLDAISSISRKGNTLHFNVRTETLYFTPGFLRKKTADGDRLTLVRCKVGKECRVDIPLAVPPKGESYEVELPKDISKVIRLDAKSGSLTIE
jgi:hypothetical protein